MDESYQRSWNFRHWLGVPSIGICLLANTGCFRTTEQLEQIIYAGRSNVVSSIPIAREFRTVFTNCQVSIANSVQHRPRFRNVQLTADLFDRYLLHLNLEVEFTSWKRLEVESYNVEGFYLSEVTSISTAENGNSVHAHGDSFTFGAAQWRTLMANNFRFDLIGIAVKTNQPMPRFRQERDAELAL